MDNKKNRKSNYQIKIKKIYKTKTCTNMDDLLRLDVWVQTLRTGLNHLLYQF